VPAASHRSTVRRTASCLCRRAFAAVPACAAFSWRRSSNAAAFSAHRLCVAAHAQPTASAAGGAGRLPRPQRSGQVREREGRSCQGVGQGEGRDRTDTRNSNRVNSRAQWWAGDKRQGEAHGTDGVPAYPPSFRAGDRRAFAWPRRPATPATRDLHEGRAIMNLARPCHMEHPDREPAWQCRMADGSHIIW
jgi:hypothetical protein